MLISGQINTKLIKDKKPVAKPNVVFPSVVIFELQWSLSSNVWSFNSKYDFELQLA
jgi:hypothetical protein